MNLYRVPTDNGLKPEGFGVELADVFLRLCDFAEALQFTIPIDRVCYVSSPSPEELACELSLLHALVSDYRFGSPAFATDWSGRILAKLRSIATSVDLDLFAMAELKHEYNKTRPIRHGGKVL
jgi:hypothetical protein